MLNIQIDDPELEERVRETYGDNVHAIAQDFMTFLRQERIKGDVGVSIEQLNSGNALPLGTVMQEIRAKYE